MDSKYRFNENLLRTSKELLNLQDYINHMESKMIDYENPKGADIKVSDKEASKLADEMDIINALLVNNLDSEAPEPDDDKPFYSKKYRNHVDRFVNDFSKFKTDKQVNYQLGVQNVNKLKAHKK